MPIRIICRAKWCDRREYPESQGVKSSLAEYLKASYTDSNEETRILCGSI